MTTIKAALDDLLNNRDDEVETVAARHLTADYRQCVDGEWQDRATFLAFLTALRSAIRSAQITVLDELTEGRHYAERHLITVTQNDGQTVSQEVYLFAELAEDGRFARLEELTRIVPQGADATGSEPQQ